MYKRHISIAPMMGKTDQDFIYLMKLITNKTNIFTEMIHTNAIIQPYGNTIRQ